MDEARKIEERANVIVQGDRITELASNLLLAHTKAQGIEQNDKRAEELIGRHQPTVIALAVCFDETAGAFRKNLLTQSGFPPDVT